MSRRIKYKCKQCSWEASLVAEWTDIRPKRCGNRRCGQNFLTSPTDLEITQPPVGEVPVKVDDLADSFEPEVLTTTKKGK